jgi:UrcA family protein
MSATTFPMAPRRLSLCAAALGLALAAPAAAQPGQYGDDPYTLSGVTVTAPAHHQRDSATGAPIEWVSTSRVVRYGDLDLGRRWGVRELRARVERAARSACNELDSAYPIAASDTPPCVRDAVRQAMASAPIGEYAENGW